MVARGARMTAPLVSIGLPTFNRAERLAVAIDSALRQTHAALALVVSDNASDDATEQLCAELARAEPRLRYVRHPVNRGPIANINAVLAELRGDYVMLLADDDRLDEDYVERCLAELRARPDHALVGGLARYVDADGRHVADGHEVALSDDDGGRRVCRYLREVDDNGIFYGLMRREPLLAALPMREFLGSDWLLIAAVLFDGKARTIATTRVHRTTGGVSRSVRQIMGAFPGAGRLQRRVPFAYTAANVFADVAWRSDVYARAGRARRMLLAVRCALSAMRWLGSAWLLAGPAIVRFLDTAGGRRLARPFAWVIRRLGRSPEQLPPL
jgi:glycosyltransferase involved in cell wall biosynthesis